MRKGRCVGDSTIRRMQDINQALAVLTNPTRKVLAITARIDSTYNTVSHAPMYLPHGMARANP